MDPLSITASAIAIATLAGQTCDAFATLRAISKTLPGRLHALNNEVADIELVLHQVATVVKERTSQSIPADQLTNLPQLLFQARTKLTELKDVVDHVAEACSRSKIPLVRAQAWRKVQERLQTSQGEIKSIKCSLNLLLGASNSRDLLRIRLDIEALSAITSQEDFFSTMTRQQDGLKELLIQSHQQVDERVARVEEMLQAQSDRFQASRSAATGPFYNSPLSYRRRYAASQKVNNKPPSVAQSEGFRVRVARYATDCQASCACVCHSTKRSASPKLIDRLVGQLFVGYAGLPIFSPKCDTKFCEKSQTPSISAEYWFPLGLCWSQIIRLQLGYDPNVGPQLQLSTLRRVPDSAKCVTYALDGNIEGLKGLFKQGLASPRDVSSTRGYSILRWALYGQQYETCQFLFRPLAETDNNPRNKASDIVLQGGLSKNAVTALTCLTQGSDWIENQDFTLLHKIVLGLSLHDLDKHLLSHEDNIDAVDAMGRTPLLWAAARGDSRAVSTLLGYGADPNLMDVQCAGPVSYAADRNHAVCVRLLLEAGANPDPVIPGGRKIGTPLNCAARNASDPLVLKTLLDFGADVEASGVDGKTSLHHAARIDNIDFALVLLEYGAELNAMSIVGETPLTIAITYNSYNVLQLLLDRWFEYSTCVRLKGPHLLQFVASYADVRTMTILANTDHFKLKYDKGYTLIDFAVRLKERSDVDEKLIQAFEDLLGIIKEEPPSQSSKEALMESGLLVNRRLNLNDYDGDLESDSGSSIFEMAMEQL